MNGTIVRNVLERSAGKLDEHACFSLNAVTAMKSFRFKSSIKRWSGG